jgi:hypothetical protein
MQQQSYGWQQESEGGRSRNRSGARTWIFPLSLSLLAWSSFRFRAAAALVRNRRPQHVHRCVVFLGADGTTELLAAGGPFGRHRRFSRRYCEATNRRAILLCDLALRLP